MNITDLPARIASKIDVADNGCWMWASAVNTTGYGALWWQGKTRQAHRTVFELAGNTLVKGLVLDHLCRTPLCVRPDHLRQVTYRENSLAPGSLAPSAANADRTHCVNGHEFTEVNTYTRIRRNGYPTRSCRACARIKSWSRKRNRQAVAS